MIHRPLLLCLLVLPLLTGCWTPTRPLQIEPVKKAAPISPRFSSSFYYYDRDRNLYFVMRSHTNDAATGKPVDQVITARVFWRPKGGVTSLNPSALNATFRYVVMTPDAIGMYEGAGFVRFTSKPGDSKFTARIMDGDMRLTQASATFVDTLGRAHINGGFSATYDDAKAMDMILGAEREFFARSMESKAATMPSTQPAQTAPATTTGAATIAP